MSYKPAICSMSLGRAWAHDITPKFTAAAAAGLPGIEIFYEDLLYLASTYPGGATPSNQLLAAHTIKSLCSSLNLEIIGIGPFNNCEGLLCPVLKAQKRQELELWFQVAHILETDIIQIPCTFLPESDERIIGDLEVVARDLREIAELGAAQEPPFRFAYENLCWGTYNDTWSKAWDVVAAVDRPNFGLCLDTFNIAGREFADPSREDGKVVDAERVFKESLERMVKTVLDVLRTICNDKEDGGMGYKGWVSMELFNRSLVVEREEVPMEHAVRAMESWRKIVQRMGWEELVDNEEGRKQVPVRRIENAPERVEISARL